MHNLLLLIPKLHSYLLNICNLKNHFFATIVTSSQPFTALTIDEIKRDMRHSQYQANWTIQNRIPPGKPALAVAFEQPDVIEIPNGSQQEDDGNSQHGVANELL